MYIQVNKHMEETCQVNFLSQLIQKQFTSTPLIMSMIFPAAEQLYFSFMYWVRTGHRQPTQKCKGSIQLGRASSTQSSLHLEPSCPYFHKQHVTYLLKAMICTRFITKLTGKLLPSRSSICVHSLLLAAVVSPVQNTADGGSETSGHTLKHALK